MDDFCSKHFSKELRKLNINEWRYTTGARNNQFFFKDENFVSSKHFLCKEL